jgi:hypothetical protein
MFGETMTLPAASSRDLIFRSRRLHYIAKQNPPLPASRSRSEILQKAPSEARKLLTKDTRLPGQVHVSRHRNLEFPPARIWHTALSGNYYRPSGFVAAVSDRLRRTAPSGQSVRPWELAFGGLKDLHVENQRIARLIAMEFESVDDE